ncbi:MAG TPA: putative sulfate exporter family transporter [Polyangiaceae bacterium]|nr:putative sulfate exporter family transporter [Polyangiaceae bacterium]
MASSSSPLHSLAKATPLGGPSALPARDARSPAPEASAPPPASATITRVNALPAASTNTGHGVAFLVALAVATSFGSPAIALAGGTLVGLASRHPFADSARAASKLLLQWCVVGLGFGMDWHHVLEVSRACFVDTALSIAVTVAFGVWFGCSLGVNKVTALLISVGTAICGGSAIAAIGPSVGAKEEEMSVSLGAVFALNACALLTFPLIGRWLSLSPDQFGLWAALAIHDTSSVVGAATEYGAAALGVATTVKLVRALWIVPLSVGAAWFRRKDVKVKYPWFIPCFCLAVLLNSHFELARPLFERLHHVSRLGLSVTLFLIGSGISRAALRKLGTRVMLQAVALWYLVAVGTLGLIRNGYIAL